MITPDVRFLDFDPEPWAEVHRIFALRRHRPAWTYVLHEAGRVVKVTAPPGPGIPQLGEPVADALSLARQVRAAADAERAVVLDMDQLPDLVRRTAERVDPSQTLPDWRALVSDAYWGSPAVATDPAPPRDPWPAVRAALAAFSAQVNALLVLEQDGTAKLAVTFIVIDGIVHEVRGLELGDLAADAAAEQRLGSLHIVLHCEWAALEQAVVAGTPAAFADGIEQARVSRGLDLVPPLLRSL